MKRKILLILSILLSVNTLHGAGDTDDLKGSLGNQLNITTYTSEPCGIAGEKGGSSENSGITRQTARYKCTLSASNGFIEFISSIYKFVFFISLVVSVLLMVILGLGMSFSGIASEDMKEASKKKLLDILYGLIALSMIPWILKTLAPFFFT